MHETTGAPSPDRTRVVRLFSRLNIGGPSVHVLLLTGGLREKGYETRLIVGREAPSEGNLLEKARQMGIEVEQLGGLGREIRPFSDLVTLFELYRRLRALRPACGAVARDALVGIVGRLVPIKAVDAFLRAAAHVAGRLPSARVAIVGDGERRPDLERAAERLGLGDRARFVGWRTDLE